MKSKPSPISDHLEANRVAALLDITARTVKTYVERGELRGVKIGKRLYVNGDSLRDWLKAREVAPIAA